jgi:hypothetical protein
VIGNNWAINRYDLAGLRFNLPELLTIAHKAVDDPGLTVDANTAGKESRSETGENEKRVAGQATERCASKSEHEAAFVLAGKTLDVGFVLRRSAVFGCGSFGHLIAFPAVQCGSFP